MYFDTYIDYRDQVITDQVEKEMHRTRETALKIVSKYVHFYNEEFAQILAYSYLENHEQSTNLANCLNLSKMDFLAIVEDYDGFKREYLRDLEIAGNF